MSVLVWPLLYQGVVDFFAEESTVCENYFGWTGPTRKPKAPGLRKVSWVPGDDKGDAGAHSQPLAQPSARSLATLGEVFTIYVYAADPNTPTELAQYAAARLLYDAWFRAVWHACAKVGTVGRFAILSLTWETEKKERPHGACLRAVCTVQAQIPDTPSVFAPVDMVAELTGQFDDPNSETDPPAALGGVAETQTITKDDEP